MILENIDFSSSNDYIYMERYVNVGSPSGFDKIYTTSAATNAKGENTSFNLVSIDLPENISIKDYGTKPDFFIWQMLVHPDMINDKMFSICNSMNKKALLVAPMASSRTVKMIEKDGWFLKLNYNGLIGRLDRHLGKNQAQSAIEVSNIIERAIVANQLPKTFFFMRETFARVIDLPQENSIYDWGIVLREPNPFPNTNEIKYTIPAFSLFSHDDKKPKDKTLLTQLIERQNKNVEDFLLEDIIFPVFESYFELLLKCGLQLELHAQNAVFALGDNFKIIGIIAKDAESIDKDLTLMTDLNIDNVKYIQTLNYKCRRKGDYNYFIMHSFMFDFKLGEYLILPIIKDAYKNFKFDKKQLFNKIKAFNQSYISKLPNDFFPQNWYSYAKKVHDPNKKRKYIINSNPKFR